jgi:hypothetical protein
MGIADEIQRLADLHQNGALTVAEFAAAKAAVLSAHSSSASPETPTNADETSPGPQPPFTANDMRKVTRAAQLGCLATLLLSCLICCGFPWWSDMTYSEGERVGVIVKLSHKGVIWTTWEGEMQLGGVRPGEGGVVPNLWEFSLRRGEEGNLVEKISEAQESGKRVKVRYRQALWWAPWRGSTDYYVQSIEVLGQ